jgi:hypothetical protein
MTPRDTVQSRRGAILAAAASEMHRAGRRRLRNTRVATAAIVAAIGVVAALLLPRGATTVHEQRTLAIDFATVAARPTTIDFAIVDSSTVPVLDTLTDREAEEALAESGYCVKILRVEERPLLVDCTTGSVAVLRP